MAVMKGTFIDNTTLQALLDNKSPSGALLIAMNDQAIFQQSFGYADIQKKIPITMDTQLLIASVTKQFTGVALLKALFDTVKSTQAIKASLAKPVDHFLPKNHAIWEGVIPEWAHTITLHQLLNHTSGIPNYTSLPDFEKMTFLSPAQLVSCFKNLPLEYTPGSKFSYNNSGYFLLGIMIEQITGQPLDLYMKAAFFDPLGMQSTDLPMNGTVNDLIKSDPRFTHLARGYQFESGIENPPLEEVRDYVSMMVPGAGGSLISTVNDLLKWNNALYKGEIIPLFLVELLVEKHIPTELPGEYYGYGIEIKSKDSLGEYYTHRGGIPGYRSVLTWIPSLQISVIIVENVHESRQRLKPEIDRIKAELPPTLSEFEKGKQIDLILEQRFPMIPANKKTYQLGILHDDILQAIAGHD